MFKERQRRGELPAGEDITFVMVTGDGGMDIGMGPAIGAAHRNHRMIILEYDNQGYMNTGAQLCYSTPLGHRTSTSDVGPGEHGKRSTTRTCRRSSRRRTSRTSSPATRASRTT